MITRKNRKGFTLAELMLVVAIIIVLASLAFVGVARYLRGLRLMEMDNAAKEIYFAAQNRITAELVSGSLGRLDADDYSSDSAPDRKMNIDGTDVYVVRFPDASRETDTSLWDELLPFGAIDETIRLDGYYIITYTFEAENNLANVRDVWYTADSNRGLFRNWTGSEDALKGASTEELTRARIDGDRKYRLHFPNGSSDRAVIGHYGGEGISLDRKQLGVTLELKNDEVLYLKGNITIDGIKPTSENKSLAQVNIIVEGLTSGAIKTLRPLDSHIEINDNGEFYFVLDDVTKEGKRFRDQFDHDEKGIPFYPGEDIRVTVEVYSNSTLANIDRATAVDNSLFQYVKPVKADDKKSTSSEAGIGKVRHLQNLSNAVSGVELGIQDEGHEKLLGINSALQTTDLNWEDFKQFKIKSTDTPLGGNIQFNKNETEKDSTADSFYPIDLKASNDVIHDDGQQLKYSAMYTVDGSSEPGMHKISNLQVGSETYVPDHAGLFGTIEKTGSVGLKEGKQILTVDHLIMENPKISGRTTAGTVVANEKGAVVLNTVSITDATVTAANGQAGGAVGQAVNGLDLVKVTVTGNSTKVTATNGNAGGLIGELAGTGSGVHMKIDSSYVGDKESKEITVKSDGTNAAAAGGLVGKITKGLPTIQNSYSTALVEGDTAGGLVGAIEECYTGSTIKSCYVGGHTDQGTDGKGTAKYATEAEKCNVKSTSSTGVSGGFIGSIGTSASNKLTVTASYTTASASGDQAGGFIGKTEANVSISNSYAVGLVVDKTSDTTASGAFVGNSTGTLTGEGNRYFELINGAMPAVVGSNPATTFVQSAETSLKTYNDFVQLGQDKEFFPYDTSLGDMFDTRYYLPTARELNGADDKAPSTHVGDWQPVDTLVTNTPDGT